LAKEEVPNMFLGNDLDEILNPEELLRPLTIENLENLDYKPKSRNKLLLMFF